MASLDWSRLLAAYARGIFPMAEARDDPEIYWVDPEMRGILPLDSFHVPRRLQRSLRQQRFQLRIDHDFATVLSHCARSRDDSWINPAIERLYLDLFAHGHAHSVESWRDGELVGGLYGVCLKGAFFGESMFSLQKDASKTALVHLVAHLKQGGYSLLDTQFLSHHLQQFGAIEIDRAQYHGLLAHALAHPAFFPQDLKGQA